MTRTDAGRRRPKAPRQPADRPDHPSSPGDSPVVQTPKEVHPHHAAARDLTERNVNSDDPAERREALLDEASDLSFPASDPISVSSAAVRKEEEAKPGANAKPRSRRRAGASGKRRPSR